LDNLGKFEAKGDEGYFVRYSMSSKAFRVFNKRTRRVEENLHLELLENKAIEKGTKHAGSQEVKKDVSSLRYIALPNWVHDALLESSLSKPQDDCSSDVPESSGNTNSTAASTNPPADQLKTLTVETPIPTVSSPVLTACFTDSPEPSIDSDGVEADVSNMETTITASPTPTLRIHKDHPKSQIIDPVDTPIQTRNKSKEVEAMQEELLQFKIQNVWTLVDCPKGVRPIGKKWVLKNKKDESGIVIRNKARLVAQGHTQEEWIYYDEVFSPVVRIEAIRLFLAYASLMGFIVYQMDVKSAFLYGTIDEEVYVMQHPRFQDPYFPAKVYKVAKAMYGLHQAPRAWLVAQGHTQKEGIDYDEVFAPVARIEAIRLFLAYASFMGFTVYQMDVKSAFLYGTIDEEVGTIDQTLFIRRQREDFILVQVYVDDIIFRSSNPQLCREFEALVHEKFQMSAMGELNFFLGLQVLQKEDGIFLTQDKYVGYILNKFGYLDVRSSNTPMDKENPWGKDGTKKDVDLHLYRSMIGSLMYLTASRPDIMFAVCACARHQVKPKECHLHAVKRIFRYLNQTRALDRKLTTGGCQFLGRRLISWQCKKQTIMATSTTEAEYVAAASCCGQVLWIQNQLLDYGMQLKLDELMGLCTSLQRQHSEMVAKFEAQELEINRLKARVKLLEDREGVAAERSGDDAPIKGRNLDKGEPVAERVSDDTEEMAIVLTSMDAATVLASGVAEVPTGSGSIPTAGPPAAEVPAGSDVVPTAGLIFATATVVTPYTRRKGKETMVESKTPKKKKIQEQIDIHMARQLDEEMERDAQRMNEQIARDAKIARIHAKEELQIMIDGLDRSNEIVAKYL
nr:hypothetical protein [Tanacetum cinerariifolium]